MNDKLAKNIFLLSLIIIGYVYGYYSHRLHLFPAKFVAYLENGVNRLIDEAQGKLPFHYSETDKRETIINPNPEAMDPGLTLISRVGRDDELRAEVIDADGTVIHQWSLNWFDIWPEV